MKIKLLPQNLINQIAAGEVIERPSSVLKELVENSLDAGAKNIEIIFESGGKTLISVKDDGAGMNKADLEMCILRHATSKLSEEDIMKIKFLGFRGEAIPSIASISKMTITSSDGIESNELYIEGGDLKYLKPKAYDKGTKIEVMDIFYSVPARLKFMKSERSENAKALDIIYHLSLAYPDVNFKFNNKINLRASSDDFFQNTLKRMEELTDKNFKNNSFLINSKSGDLSLKGFSSLPTYTSKTSKDMYFFVNKRPVEDKLFYGSIKAAYSDFIFNKEYPICVLFLDLPAEEVDVNVHPTKAEVRFKKPAEIRSLLISSIKNAIYENAKKASSGSFDLKKFIKKKDDELPIQKPVNKNFFNEDNSQFYHYDNEQEKIQNDNEKLSYPLGQAIVQVNNTYIISQNETGIFIIDQHAAHERILYEKFKESREFSTQILLLPEEIKLDKRYVEILIDGKDDLKKFGLNIEKKSDDIISIKEIPSTLGNGIDFEKLLFDLADNLDKWDTTIGLEEKINHIAKTYCCHSSVRAGKKLSLDEMNALLRKMETTQNSGQCNHGRPTYIELTFDKIDALFKR